MMRACCGRFRDGKNDRVRSGWEGPPAAPTPEGGTMDVQIALLQSIVVLLLASGVYVALVVRKNHD